MLMVLFHTSLIMHGFLYYVHVFVCAHAGFEFFQVGMMLISQFNSLLGDYLELPK